MGNLKTVILQGRAEKLLQESTIQVDEKLQENLVLEFNLGNEQYAIESRYIREVYPLREVTRLPGVPSFIKGILNVRRRIISLIDIRVLFELPIQESTATSKVIILQHRDIEFAIMTDSIIGVRKVNLHELQTSLPTLTDVRQEFLKGFTLDNIIVLDGEKILTSDRLVVNQTN